MQNVTEGQCYIFGLFYEEYLMNAHRKFYTHMNQTLL